MTNAPADHENCTTTALGDTSTTRGRRLFDRTACGHLLIAIGTDARSLVIFGAVVVGTVVERAVSLADRSPASLVHEMPVEAHKRTMLVAFVL